MLWDLGHKAATRFMRLYRKYPVLVWAAVALIVFTAGTVWRAEFIFQWHPLSQYASYSDMQNYFNEMTRFFTPHLQLGRADALYPPGTSLLFGYVYHFKYSWYAVSWLQFLLSALTPLLLAAIGYLLYGRATALILLVMASCYIAFVEYSGYLLSETPYIFFQLLAFLLLLLGLRTKHRLAAVVWGLLAGGALGWTAIIRPVALLPALFVAIAIVLVKLKSPLKLPYAWLLLICAAAGLLPFLIGASIRCTQLNKQFCMVSSNGSETVLQGHYYNHVGNFVFEDKANGYTFTAGDTTMTQLGFNDWVTLPWGAYDQHQNLRLVKTWATSHPKQAVEFSFLHIYNLFRTVPWPSEDTPADKHRIILSEQLFRAFILLPAAVYTAALAFPAVRKRVRQKSSDLIVIAPILGLFVLVFITVGNPRYRLPFDVFFMLLAARAYTLAGEYIWHRRKAWAKLRNRLA